MTGLCECGCGEATAIAPRTRPEYGQVAGQPMRFVHNHHRRKAPVEYVVNRETGCWIWQRAIVDGYGTIGVGGGRVVKAHRLYYERAKGPIPVGHELHHRCHTRACVNPDHLEPLTRLAHRREHPRPGERAAA